MALTTAQTSQIRSVLGYAQWEIAQEINELSQDATRESMVVAALASIAALDSALAAGIAQTGVWATGGGETEMNRGAYLQELRRQGRMLCNRIADAVLVPKRRDWFDSAN